MATTILMGPETLARRLALADRDRGEVVLATDAEAVYGAVRESLPELLVLDTSSLTGDIRQFLEQLLGQRSDFRAPVYVVDTRSAELRVGVCEWSPEQRAFRASETTLERLLQEIDKLRELGQAAAVRAKDVGYYDYIDREGQFFHVQTEVIPQRNPIVQTTVLKGGAVLDVVSSKIEAGGGLDLRSEEAARAQHRAACNRVNAGRYS